MATLLGSLTTGGGGDFFADGDAAGSKWTAVATGSLEQVSIPVDISDTFIIGVYADSAGSPGALLGTSSTAPATGSSVTRTVTFTPTVSIASGTAYWLFLLPVGGGNLNLTLAASGGYVGKGLGDVSAFPDPWDTTGNFNNGSGGAIAMLGEGTLGGGGGATVRMLSTLGAGK